MTAPIDEGTTGDESAVDSSAREVPRVDDAPLPYAAADRAGPFRLGARIGEGAWASCTPRTIPTAAAGRREDPPAALGGDPARVRRFEAEAEVLARDGAAVAAALDALVALEATPATVAAPIAPATVDSSVSLPPSAAPLAALTGGERRLLSVVLIGEERAEPAAPTVARAEAEDGLAALRRAAAANGSRAERLVDGSIAVSIEGAGSATDRAALAARCALSLRPLAGRRPMALALGRAEHTGRLGMGHAIDAAARLIAGSGAPPSRPEGDEEAQAVAIDEVTARLLDARFVVKESAPGLALLGERELTGEARTLLGKATPCVGRDRELAALEGLFRACVEERTAQAELLRRTLAIDVLACPACKGRMKLVAMLTEPRSIARFLTALGEPTEVPVRSPLCQRRVSQTAPGNLW